MNKKVLIGGLAGSLLVVAAAVLLVRNSYTKRIGQLENQIEDMKKQERQSAIDRRVSKQMEEIAYGQQALSEERSREAIRQSEIAQKMTLRSEEERKNALKAQARAEESARQARESYQVAEQQRKEADLQRQQADLQRQQAVHAKLVADTLNYLSLARTLGSQSYSMYQAGEKDLGNMLAYTAYLFSRDYHGDFFAPSVLQAITQSAEARHNWRVHNGTISKIVFFPRGRQLLTVSTYGEVFAHNPGGGQLNTQRLLYDRRLCFRDALVMPSGKAYAVSHTGHLAVINKGAVKVVNIDRVSRPFSLAAAGNNILIVGEREAALYDTAADRLLSVVPLSFKAVCVCSRAGKPLIFDDKGMMYFFTGTNNLTAAKVPAQGQVCAYACSDNGRYSAYGTMDGTIYLTDEKGKVSKLVGHLSQVSEICFFGDRLFSSSYDGKLFFWHICNAQIRPVTLMHNSSWITAFSFDNSHEYIWMGDANATLTDYLISMPLIAQRLKQNVKRNLTQEEWNYYIGSSKPYRKIKE